MSKTTKAIKKVRPAVYKEHTFVSQVTVRSAKEHKHQVIRDLVNAYRKSITEQIEQMKFNTTGGLNVYLEDEETYPQYCRRNKIDELKF